MQENDNQDFLANAARSLYGNQKRKEEEQRALRNSLLSELGDKAEAKHILYSSNEELRKMRDEMIQKPLQVPLPENRSRQQSPRLQNNNDKKEVEIDLAHKAQLLEKIQLDKEKTQDNTPNDDNEERGMTPIKAYLRYDEDRNEEVVENNKKDTNSSNKQEGPRQSKIQDEQFNKLMEHVYKAEGGYSNRKNDRGGKTNYGITQTTYDAYNKKHGLPLKDVKQITYDEADQIYYNEYYKASGADKIKDKNLAYMHFDAAVNHGVGGARRLLEQSGGTFDGYYNARENKFKNIVKNDPTQQEHLNGWMNRINKIKKMRDENLL